MRAAYLLYGLVCYVVFLLTFVYAIGFLGNFLVPRTVDAGGPTSPSGLAAVINIALLSVFAIQHSVMARRWFKQRWTQIVPKPVERATYVLLSSLAMILLYWQWRPMPAVVWDASSTFLSPILWLLFGAGWLLVLTATLMINHFELFGLQQVIRHYRGTPDRPNKFQEPYLYKYVRHPLYVGWFLTFWAIPTMTVGHLLFAAVASGYILVAIQFEERDLRHFHPEYDEYSRRVPMLIPGLGRLLGRNRKAPQ